MKLKIYIEEFLDYQKKEGFLADVSANNYRSKLEVFYDFLYEYEKVHDNTLDTVLNGLEINKIFESINFYIRSRRIKSVDLCQYSRHIFSNKFYATLLNLSSHSWGVI